MSITVTPVGGAAPRPREIAIGTFDGVHVGHRQVIEGADTVLTFEGDQVAEIEVYFTRWAFRSSMSAAA